MIIWLSALASIIPMTFYLIFLRNMDKFEREPLKLILKHFIWGATGAIFFAILGSEFLAFPVNAIFVDTSLRSLLMAVIVAPLVEETTKGIYLFKTAKYFEFDNVTDGLVYGGAIGLGFGMTENFFYFLSAANNISTWIATIVVRTTFSAVMHSMATASFGAFLAIRKFSTSKFRNLLPLLGIAIAVFIHFMWNISVSFSFTSFFGFIFLAAVIITFFIVFKLSLNKETQIIETELKGENIPSIITDELLSIAKKSKKRIDQSINKEYISLAVKLAFRKRQLKTATGEDRIFYLQNIIKLRESLDNHYTILISKESNER